MTNPFPLELGQITITTIADPAVATGFTYTSSPRVIEQLIAIYYLFDTDANAADRHLYFRLDDATNIISSLNTNFVIIASTLTLQSWNVNANNFLDNTGLPVDESNNFIPPGLIFPVGATLTQIIANVQAGDQVSQIQLTTRTWART